MSRKRIFPGNWSNLKDEQVLENLRYLLGHYKKYEIIKYSDKYISIGNVFIRKYDNFSYVVNSKRYIEIGKPITGCLAKLLSMGKQEFNAREKRKERATKIITFMGFATALIIAEMCVFYLEKNKIAQERNNKEKFKQEVIRQYQQEHAKDTVYVFQNQRQ